MKKSELEKFMWSLHCSQISFETLCQMYLDKEAENKDLKDTMDLIMTYMHTLRPESVATRFEWIIDKIEKVRVLK